MKKFLVVSFCLLMATGMVFGTEFNLFLSGGFSGTPRLSDSNYSLDGAAQHIAVSHSGTISPEAKSSFVGEAGLEMYFSDMLGVRLSGSFWSNNVDLQSNYNISWLWETGVSGSDSGSWKDTGKISVTTLNIDFVYKTKLSNRMTMEVYGGPTLFSVKTDLDSHIGGFSTLTENYWWGWKGWIDWFGYKANINASETIFGGNVGLNLSSKLSPNFSLFIAFEYYIASKKTYEWMIVPGTYNGQYGFFTSNITSPTKTGTTLEVNPSNFAVVIGAKFHL